MAGPKINPVGPSGPQSKSKKGAGPSQKYDTYGLGVNGSNQWVYAQQLPGAYDFFTGQPAPGSSGVLAHPAPGKELTAQQALQHFQQLTGYQLAQIQYQMYRAGLYGSNTPIYGVYGDQDLAAFRKVVIALANGPHVGGQNLSNYLSQIADLGDKQGVNAVRKAPLVLKHVDDDTLKMTFQSAAKQILGDGKLGDNEINRMVAAYHQMETTNQTQAYNAGDPNLTGVLTGGLGGSATVTPSPTEFAATQIQSAHPDQVARQQFSDTFSKIIGVAKSAGATGSAGG